MKNFDRLLKKELDSLKKAGLLRKMAEINSGCFPRSAVGTKTHINLCSNNYLALNGHPYIRRKMCMALERWGTSAGASRLIAGNLKIFEEAEERLAKFKNKDASLIFNSGYQANVSVIPALVGEEDEIFSDSLNHASIIDGCALSKAKVSIYLHSDMNHLGDLLKKSKARKKMIVTDGVFSMDGDTALLKEISKLAGKYDAAVFVDDAHGTGVLGKTGSGTAEHLGVYGENIIVLGTGGKALGVSGAFVCCSKIMREYLVNRCRGFIYSTAPSPCVPAGLLAAVEIVKREPERRKKLLDVSGYFWKRLQECGYKTSTSSSHIIPMITGGNEDAVNTAGLLMKNRILAIAIRPPTVPEGTARIRFSLTAAHTKEDIERVMEVLIKSKIQNPKK